jgi:glycerophosphoryl diester phosphodiesterase
MVAWSYPRVFAHRGGGTLAPENTLAGLAAGVAHGHRAVEFDAMLTCDEVPVLMHDAAFGRTISGRGSVAKTTAKAISQLDAGAWFDAAFDGEKVPTLAQALDYCSRHNVFMNIEIKPAPGFDRETGARVAAAARSFAATRGDKAPLILLSSFSSVALEAAQLAAPELPRGYLLHRLKGDWIGQLEALECVALHCNHELVDDKLVADMHQRGLGVFCYTVNSVRRAEELRQLGIDALCTDRIDLIGPDFFSKQTLREL